MAAYTLQNSQSQTFAAGALNGASLRFAGTAGGGVPLATISGTNGLANVYEAGSAAAPGYGAINVTQGASVSTSGLILKNASLSLADAGGSVTFMGSSTVSNNSTLAATGSGNHVSLNGPMLIDGTSKVDLSQASVDGSGMFLLLGGQAQLSLGATGGNNSVTLNGGVLNLSSGLSFLGTITDSDPSSGRIGQDAAVDVFGAATAVSETFNRETGMLHLFDAKGAAVANLTFAGTGDLYAAQAKAGGSSFVAITTHSGPGTLPVSFS